MPRRLLNDAQGNSLGLAKTPEQGTSQAMAAPEEKPLNVLDSDVSLAGKVAVVTGGSSGMGADVARRFAAQGAQVCVCARREAELKGVVTAIEAAGGMAMYVVCDISVPAQVEDVMEKTVAAYGRLDILFNNAGFEGSALWRPQRKAAVLRIITNLTIA